MRSQVKLGGKTACRAVGAFILVCTFGCEGNDVERIAGRYQVALESELRLGENHGGLRVLGRLDVSHHGFTLSELQCSRPNGTADEELRAFCQDITDQYPLERNASGSILRIGLPEGFRMEPEALIKSLASSLQLTVSDPRTQSWEIDERDTVGTYRAIYSRGHGMTLRSKNRYLDSDAKVDGATEFYTDKTGVVTQVHATETLTRDGRSNIGALASKVTTRLTLVRQGDAHATPSSASARRWVALSDAPSPDAQQRSIDERRVRTVDYHQLTELLSLRPARAAHERRRAYDDASLALISLVRLQPSYAQRIFDDCVDEKPWCRVALGALGAAGTPAAQRALREVHGELSGGERDSKQRASLRRQAIRALGTRLADRPTDETVRYLIAQLGDGTVGTQAAYGLGALGGRAFRANERALSDRCLAPLLNAAKNPESRNRLLASLRGLSNARVPTLAHTLTPLFEASDTPVAAAAVGALYGLPYDTAKDGLALAMNDPRDAVQHAALKVIAANDAPLPPPLRRAVSEVARSTQPGLAPRLASKLLKSH